MARLARKARPLLHFRRVTSFLLIRHASHDLLGRILAGRMPGVHLNPRGHREAGWLRERLRSVPLRAVVTSPLERSLETAQPIASEHGLALEIDPDLSEMAFGDWTGRSFEDLECVPGWKSFNACRSVAAVPGGERMLETQTRAVAALERLRERHDEATIAVVSHGDVLRAVVAHYLGLSLDFLHRFEIEPASITTIHVAGHGATLQNLNDSPARLEFGEDPLRQNGNGDGAHALRTPARTPAR